MLSPKRAVVARLASKVGERCGQATVPNRFTGAQLHWDTPATGPGGPHAVWGVPWRGLRHVGTTFPSQRKPASTRPPWPPATLGHNRLDSLGTQSGVPAGAELACQSGWEGDSRRSPSLPVRPATPREEGTLP